jgi:hypothetical protein
MIDGMTDAPRPLSHHAYRTPRAPLKNAGPGQLTAVDLKWCLGYLPPNNGAASLCSLL